MPQQHRSARDAALLRARFIGVDLDCVVLRLDGRAVLRGVSWSIRPGQRWVLTGHNGAGKTLLLKMIGGDLWPTASQGRRFYFYRGERFEQPYAVREEICYLGAERQDRYERYGWNHRVEQVIGSGLYRTDIPLDELSGADQLRIARLLRRLRLQALAGRHFLTLSYGERRLVLLARALATAPKLLLLDELFNGLDTSNRARAMHCLDLLSRSALPWVLSSHRVEEVPPWVTHHCELQAGSIRSQGPVRPSAPSRRTATAHTPDRPDAPGQRRLRPPPASGPPRTRRASGRPAPPLIWMRRATVWREGIVALQDLSVQLHAGQCWVVHGANGSGKSTFLQLLYGDLGVAWAGLIKRDGIGRGVPIARFKRRVGLVAPELQAMHPREVRVEQVVASGLEARISYGEERARHAVQVRRALRQVGALSLQRRLLRTLSYGQLRRVLFARALVADPDILLLDEPYTGLDAATRMQLRALVQRAVNSGVTAVIATHHQDDRPAGATHELELSQGRAVYQGPVRGEPR